MSKKSDGPKIDDGVTPGPWPFAFTCDVPWDPWTSAVAAYDQGDRHPLLDLIVSDEPISAWGHALITDLIQRQGAKRGRPATPLYERSETEAALVCAMAEVRSIWRHAKAQKANLRKFDLINRVAELHGVSPHVLERALDGKLPGGIRRILARLPRP
jgi:hypothetical protein